MEKGQAQTARYSLSLILLLAVVVMLGGLLCTWGQRARNCQRMDMMFISDHRGDRDSGAVYHLNSQNTEVLKPQKLNAF